MTVVLAFFYLVELSVLSNALTSSGLSSKGLSVGGTSSNANLVTCSKLAFGIAMLMFLLLLGLLVLSWYDYQRFEASLLVSNSCLFGLTMGFLMAAFELLYSPLGNSGLFACNVLIVLFFPALDILDLRPIASLGLEEGFNLMRRARDTKALSTAFDSISVTIDGEGEGESEGEGTRDELEVRARGESQSTVSRIDIQKRLNSVSRLAIHGATKSVDADTFYSSSSSALADSPGQQQSGPPSLEDGLSSGPASYRQARRMSRVSPPSQGQGQGQGLSLSSAAASAAAAAGPSSQAPDDLVTISFGAGGGGGGGSEPPAWWDPVPPPSKRPAPERVPEASNSGHASPPPALEDEAALFDGFRLRLEKMPMSLYNPPVVAHNLPWDAFVNVVHRIDSSSCHIYTALWESARRQVIIKLIKADRVHLPMAVSEFESEAEVLSHISHPHVVRLLGTGTQPRRFLVLELLDGGSLSHLLGLRPDAHNRVSRKRFTYLETLYLSRDLASALEYLHHTWHPVAHIVHRDLKPDNIGWTSDGTLKLFDFGLCTVIKANTKSHEGYKLTGNTGTLRYMAPEVAVGKPYHHSVDTYSFGIIVWQVLTGFVPFRDLGRRKYYERVVHGGARPPLDLSLPPRFRDLLTRCWHHDQNARPQFGEVIALLDELVQEQERIEAQGWRYLLNTCRTGLREAQRLVVQWRLLLLLLCTLLGCVSIAAFDAGNVQSGVLLGIVSSLGLYLFGISTLRAHLRNDGEKRGFCGGVLGEAGWREAAVVGLELGAASRRVRSASGSGSAGSDKRRLLGLGGWGPQCSTRGSEHHLYGVNF